MTLEPGSVVAGYRIERQLGAGGMGVVYEATQISLGRLVAFKVLSRELSQDHAFRERFRREGQVQALLRHPHIVTVFDSGEDEAGLYLAMDLIKGSTLKEMIPAGGLAAERVLRLLEPIGSALDEAHRADLIHRDVKPHNILVGDDDHPYLADFGITKAPEAPALTLPDQFLGTVHYTAPEQLMAQDVTCRSDIYALAAVLYESLTGEVPFPRDPEGAVIFAHLNDDPPRVTQRRSDLPVAIDRVIGHGMAKEPAGRPASAGELMREAKRALAPPTTAVTTKPQRPRTKRSGHRRMRSRLRAPPQRDLLSRVAGAQGGSGQGWRGLRGRPQILAIVVVLAVAVLVAAIGPSPGEGICGQATELRVLTSADKEDAIREAANDYMSEHEDDGCREVNVHVTSTATSGPVIAALDSDWRHSALREIGPQPDVWLPESSIDVRQVTPSALAIRSLGSIGSARVVLATTGPAAAGSVQFRDVGRLDRLKPVRTNPASSTAGLLVTHRLYEGRGGHERRAVERAILTSGDDPRSLLCQLRQTPGRSEQQSTFFVPENVLSDFRNDRALGGCPARQQHAARVRTVNLTPATVLDHPCLRLVTGGLGGDEKSPRRPRGDDVKRRQAATGFCRFLKGGEGRGTLSAHGLLAPRRGDVPDVKANELLAQWESARLPARVLLALDVSGSMNEPLLPSGTKRPEKRIEAAGKAARAALTLVDRPDDAVGLWTFATPPGSPRSIHIAQLAELAEARRPHLEQVRRALSTQPRPAGGTPLYGAIDRGASRLRRGWRRDAINALVVLSDGEDRNSELNREELIRHLDAGDQSGEPVRVFIIASLGGRCDKLYPITPAVRGGCLEAPSANALEATFRTVFASFGRESRP